MCTCTPAHIMYILSIQYYRHLVAVLVLECARTSLPYSRLQALLSSFLSRVTWCWCCSSSACSATTRLLLSRAASTKAATRLWQALSCGPRLVRPAGKRSGESSCERSTDGPSVRLTRDCSCSGDNDKNQVRTHAARLVCHDLQQNRALFDVSQIPNEVCLKQYKIKPHTYTEFSNSNYYQCYLL